MADSVTAGVAATIAADDDPTQTAAAWEWLRAQTISRGGIAIPIRGASVVVDTLSPAASADALAVSSSAPSAVITGQQAALNAASAAVASVASAEDDATANILPVAIRPENPNQPTSLFQYVGFIYYANNTDNFLTSDSINGMNILAATGSNTIDLTWNLLEATPTSDTISENGSLTGLSDAIEYAESLGLQVVLKPTIGFEDDAPGGGSAVDPTNPAEWFANYQQIIVQYAELAQQDHVALFTIGTELAQLDRQAQYLPYWTSLINAVKQVYTGELTYAAATISDVSWSSPEFTSNLTQWMPDKVDFWNQLNIIGVDAYPIVTTSAPTSAAQVAAAWSSDAYGNNWIAYLQSLSTTFDKPVMLTEVGFDSSTDAYADPGADSATDQGQPDDLQQEYLYQGTYDALTAAMSPSEFAGLTQWAESSYPVDANSLPNNDTPNGAGVFGKPAQYLLASLWGATDYMGWSESSFAGSIGNDRIALYGTVIEDSEVGGNFADITRAQTFDTTVSLTIDGNIINGQLPALDVVVNGVNYGALALQDTPSGYVDGQGVPSTTDQTFTINVPDLVSVNELELVFGSPVNVGGPEDSSAFVSEASINGVALTTATYYPAAGTQQAETIDGHEADGDSSLFDGGYMSIDTTPWNDVLAANQWGTASNPIEIDGGGGTDTVYVLGTPADYQISQSTSGTVTLTENAGLDQNAMLSDGVQYISFADGATYDIASGAWSVAPLVYWTDPATGDTGNWVSDLSGNVTGYSDLGDGSTAYTAIGVGDFGGDGSDEVLWENKTTGDTGYWTVGSSGNASGFYDIGQAATAYSIVGIGDFDGSGHDEVLWEDAATGDTGYWTTNAVGALSGFTDLARADTAYTIVGVGDFDGNGYSEVLWEDKATGDTGYWASSSEGETSDFIDLGQGDTAYSIVGVGDFDESGHDEVLWEDKATGDTGYWTTNAAGQVTGFHDFGFASTSYTVVGIGDYDGSGHDEILWENLTTSDTGYWITNAAGQVAGFHDLGNASTAYHVVPLALT